MRSRNTQKLVTSKFVKAVAVDGVEAVEVEVLGGMSGDDPVKLVFRTSFEN
jgi:hypothetical protein